MGEDIAGATVWMHPPNGSPSAPIFPSFMQVAAGVPLLWFSRFDSGNILDLCGIWRLEVPSSIQNCS